MRGPCLSKRGGAAIKAGGQIGEPAPKREEREGPIQSTNEIFFLNKKTSHLRGECRHQIGV
ncbi:hypothetical protein HanIR_Chr04g0202131 [Helianthus annuus]|nr:hypothetical protein HanIR_Chr04g0202131 [Helianthus annuus]